MEIDRHTLNTVQAHGLGHLSKEPERLKAEAERINEEIRALSANNYSVYVQVSIFAWELESVAPLIRNCACCRTTTASAVCVKRFSGSTRESTTWWRIYHR